MLYQRKTTKKLIEGAIWKKSEKILLRTTIYSLAHINVLSSDFVNAICCSDFDSSGSGVLGYLSSTDGSGHFSNDSTTWGSPTPLTAGVDSCDVVVGICSGDEVCVFRVDDPVNGHVGDCALSAFPYRLCCVPATVPDPGSPPVASFVYVPSSPVVGVPVTFTSTSTHASGQSITGYEWRINGVVESVGNPFLYSFSSDGSYLVNLSVVQSDGLSASVAQTVVVGFFTPPALYTVANPDVFDTSANISGFVVMNSFSGAVNVRMGYRVPGDSWSYTAPYQQFSGGGSHLYSEVVLGLSSCTEYEYQAVGDWGGTSFSGAILTFTTLGCVGPQIPSVTTSTSTVNTPTSVTLRGFVTNSDREYYYRGFYYRNAEVGSPWTRTGSFYTNATGIFSRTVNDASFVSGAQYRYRAYIVHEGIEYNATNPDRFFTIPAPPSLTADFTWTPNPALVDSPVSFDASASTGVISEYRWSVGGTNYGPFSNPLEFSHTFDSVGSHFVMLNVSNATHHAELTLPVDVFPCTPGQTSSCFIEGDPNVLGNCRHGTRECLAGGVWSTTCTPGTPQTEICGSGADMNCNGLIDCADPGCHGNPPFGRQFTGTPPSCVGSDQTSEYCHAGVPDPDSPGDYLIQPGVGWPNCNAPALADVVVYCGEGVDPNNVEPPHAFCCPEGTYQRWVPPDMGLLGYWSCAATQPCYNPPPNIPLFCHYDYSDNSQFVNWSNSLYTVDDAPWCVDPPGARACCPAIAFGDFGYYSELPGNVKIY